MSYIHADLGSLHREDVDWNAEDVIVPFAESRIGVSLADGSESGPSRAALFGYKWIQSNWQGVLSLIQKQVFEFYSPYADAFDGVPEFNTPRDLLRSARLRYLRIFGKDDFELTLRFDWQEPGDSHEVTFYVEGGKCGTHSVDG